MNQINVNSIEKINMGRVGRLCIDTPEVETMIINQPVIHIALPEIPEGKVIQGIKVEVILVDASEKGAVERSE